MDLSHLPIRPVDKLNGKTGDFFYLEYGYILQFSAVELKAQMSWTENVGIVFSITSSIKFADRSK